MILSKYVYVKTSKAYSTKGGEYVSTNGTVRKKSKRIKIPVTELKPNSNITVSCRCDKCGNKYLQRYSRNTDVCYPCRKVDQMIGNNLGASNKGKPILKMRGENHPRWNPNKKEYQEYRNKVNWLTEINYRKYKDFINPNDYPRTLCGIEGGYQLDHIMSVKEAFEKGMLPEDVSSFSNLQMLPWKENLLKK